MLTVPPELQAQFEGHLAKTLIPNGLHGTYRKWLRYYLDFCQKYRFRRTHKESLPQFIQKLQDKRQTNAQQEQAANAIKLYYDTLPAEKLSKPDSDVRTTMIYTHTINSRTLKEAKSPVDF